MSMVSKTDYEIKKYAFFNISSVRQSGVGFNFKFPLSYFLRFIEKSPHPPNHHSKTFKLNGHDCTLQGQFHGFHGFQGRVVGHPSYFQRGQLANNHISIESHDSYDLRCHLRILCVQFTRSRKSLLMMSR